MNSRLFTLGLLGLASCGPAPSVGEDYKTVSWKQPSNDVMITLGKNHIRGCGEFYQKANPHQQGEYAVACTRRPDGTVPEWVGYLVWTGTGAVEGPDMTAVYTQFGGPPRQFTKDDM